MTAADTAADEWEAFVINAVRGLQAAASLLRERRPEFESRKDWFRRSKGGIPRENSVSQALANMFEVLRARQNLEGAGSAEADLRHISIQCEKPRPFDSGISDASNPTDYSLVLLKDRELDLRIEAKVLLSQSEITSEYLGTRGLKRFEDASNPYTVSPFAGMVAYVVDDDESTWRSRISSEIERLVSGACRKVPMPGGEHTVSSHHLKHSLAGTPCSLRIDVLHFVIEIDAVPARR